MAKYLQKLSTFRQIIRENGGIIQSFLVLFRTDDLRAGKLVGEDKYGNKYYENNEFFLGRNRWVRYPESVGFDYDGSQVPAEWHRWLHSITDKSPIEEPPKFERWMCDHEENFTGTNKDYVPYSTARPKVESWVPPKK
ncbi:probable NADH dehydrogenase [ubiquinone] 1 alpha subcomplex subunit 12 [Lineus longissimus]|uniref:probable NADH dehydrogenase [ubiquinone] 1 alpha subcomplex subunit 12 n=1 Tax=Lineus longissimus TaxID=88925 RepID=UPI002B4CEE46